jgi:hypothetical protein
LPIWNITSSRASFGSFCGVELTIHTATPFLPNSSSMAFSLCDCWRAIGQSAPVKNSTTARAFARRSSKCRPR